MLGESPPAAQPSNASAFCGVGWSPKVCIPEAVFESTGSTGSYLKRLCEAARFDLAHFLEPMLAISAYIDPYNLHRPTPIDLVCPRAGDFALLL